MNKYSDKRYNLNEFEGEGYYRRGKQEISKSHQPSPQKKEVHKQYAVEEPPRNLSYANLKNTESRSQLQMNMNQTSAISNYQNNIVTTPSSKKNREFDESEEKRKSLIEKSKHLKDKLVKLTENTPEKFYNPPSRQTNEPMMNPKDRIEQLKNNKERFYESPFKNQVEERSTDRNHDKYMKKISLFGNNVENTCESFREKEKEKEKRNFEGHYEERVAKTNK